MSEQTPTIAVIDNTKDSRDSLCNLLESEGFKVITASNPRAGRKVFKQGSSNLVIVDLRLKHETDDTDESGLDLVEWARRNGIKTPVILLTRYSGYQSAIRALRPGVERPPLAVNYVARAEGSGAILLAIKTCLKDSNEDPDPILVTAEKQAQFLFRCRNFMAALGIGLIFVAVIAAIAGVIQAAGAGSIAAVVINAIAMLFGRQYKQAEDRLERLRNNKPDKESVETE
ncbi:MAG: response regulator [Anaerolineales bacterium]|nr:response regulator [Anaerolineales bacterium]